MKKTLIFILSSVASFAQIPFRSITEACIKNQPGTGVNVRSTVFYTKAFAVNNYAFKNNLPSSNLRLNRGYYYTNANCQNTAFEVNSEGKIANIVGCSNTTPPVGTGQYYPNFTISYALSTLPNRINWGQFGVFKLPNKFQAVWGWGSPHFSDEDLAPSAPLNRGWTGQDNVGIKSPAIIPEKYGWKFILASHLAPQRDILDDIGERLIRYGISDAKYIPHNYLLFKRDLSKLSDATLIQIGSEMQDLFPGGLDPTISPVPGYSNRINNILFDEETLNYTHSEPELKRIYKYWLQGIRAKAATTGRKINILFYGMPFCHFTGGYINASGVLPYNNEERWYPYATNTELANAQTSGFFDNTFDSCMVDATPGYMKVPVPVNESMYERSGSVYLLNASGKRIWRRSNFTDRQYEKDIPFYARPQSDQDPAVHDQITDPNYHYLPEVWFAVRQLYNQYDKLVVARHTLNKLYTSSYSLANQDNYKIQLASVIRDETEGTWYSFSAKSRNVAPFALEFTTIIPYFVGVNNLYLWTGYGERTANFTYIVKPQGQDFERLGGDGDPRTGPKNLGPFEVMTAGLKRISKIGEMGVFTPTDKILLFTKIADTSHEIISTARLNGNKLAIQAIAPYFDKYQDITENTVVTVSNSLNTTKFQFVLKAKENYTQVFDLPAGFSYTPQSIRLEYKDELGNNHKVTGDLNNHTW